MHLQDKKHLRLLEATKGKEGSFTLDFGGLGLGVPSKEDIKIRTMGTGCGSTNEDRETSQ